jgi:Zn-dependent protease with chaperone function
MDFFQRQDQARKKTKWLVIYFAVAVILIITMMYFVVWFGYYFASIYRPNVIQIPSLWNLNVFLGATLGTLAVVSIGSAYKINQLADGGSAVAQLLGGHLLQSRTTDIDERKLLNVVEEMSIASGVPMPQVYVLNNEDYINAFSAGHTTSDAAIGVTRGCITKLSRDELQGVVGHEFSHILNGDMRLNLRLIGILFGILCLATIGRILLNARGEKATMPMFFGLLLLLIGSVGVFFGRLIQAAVCRQREFLADASSVQFTRNPEGLSGALQKVGGCGSRMWSPNAPHMSHLFFGDALTESVFGAMASHPPIPDRIHAIDPAWDGKFKSLVDDKSGNISQHSTPPRPPLTNLFGTVVGGAILASGDDDEKPPVIKSRHVLPNIGNPTPLHLEYAVKLRDALPENVKSAAREPLDAVALIYAMLLSDDEKMRATQITEIGKRSSQSISDKTAALFPDVSKIAAHVHLPIINLALGGLRQLSAEQFQNFSQTLQWLIQSDGKIDLFEFVLQKIVLRNLDSQFNGPQKSVVQFYTIKPLVPDCAVILSALANVGSDDAAEIEKAFETGAPYLRAPDGADLNLLPNENCGVDKIDAALNRLAQAVPVIKKNLIEACVHVVGADSVLQEAEAELLRAIADTLDCPMPPFLPTE